MFAAVFQNMIAQMKEVSPRNFGVVDPDGYVVACTDNSLMGEQWSHVLPAFEENMQTTCVVDHKTFRIAYGPGNAVDYAVFCDGDDSTAMSLCMMAYIAINDAKLFYEERHDRTTFVKNIVLDNVMAGDIYTRARELRLVLDAPRVVFLIRQKESTEGAALDLLASLFPDRTQDFVIGLGEQDIVVVKQVSYVTTAEELIRLAQRMESTLRSELSVKTVISFGSISDHLRNLSNSYKEAQTAIAVSAVFDTEKTIINYEKLGIGRLIYQLPTTLCDIFLSEIFKRGSIEALDQETLFTINKFFENNLNVSETSRKLFVHRNTLVYRLEKIKKLTGLDLREFDHAIVFKVAMMVHKYMTTVERY